MLSKEEMKIVEAADARAKEVFAQLNAGGFDPAFLVGTRMMDDFLEDGNKDMTQLVTTLIVLLADLNLKVEEIRKAHEQVTNLLLDNKEMH